MLMYDVSPPPVIAVRSESSLFITGVTFIEAVDSPLWRDVIRTPGIYHGEGAGETDPQDGAGGLQGVGRERPPSPFSVRAAVRGEQGGMDVDKGRPVVDPNGANLSTPVPGFIGTEIRW